MSSDTRGIFTIQYPEEKLPVPEEFRYIPFLFMKSMRMARRRIAVLLAEFVQRFVHLSVSGLCARMIRRPVRPVPEPKKFYIDVDICMNCGFCAEYCPFDAIKMDHDYELSVYDRHSKNIYNKESCLKPVSYYASIRPTNYDREETARAEAEAAKAARKARA